MFLDREAVRRHKAGSRSPAFVKQQGPIKTALSSILHDIDANCVKLPVRDLMAEQKLLTPFDVAKRLQINERTVTQWLRKGHLRGFKIGKEWWVSEIDIEAFLEASANRPSDSPPRSVA